MTIAEIILLSLLVISLTLLTAVLIYYIYFRKFTRERFAFRVFLLIASLSTTLIVFIFSSKLTLALLLATLGKAVGLPQVVFVIFLSDKILGIVVIISPVYLAIK